MVNRNGFTLIECIIAFTMLSGLFLIFSISSLTIKNVKTNKTYQFGLWGKCLCLYRNDGKFLSYMLGVKRVAFKELTPYLYVITLEFDNGSIFKEEIYINGQKA